jgi:Rieske 2Fe-2S family protein
LNLAPEPEPFLEAFAPILGKFSAWNLADLRVAHRIDYDVQANWKQLVENFSECYHCPLIHPALAFRHRRAAVTISTTVHSWAAS